MAGENELASVEGQLIGMPLAGPESFSAQQLDYLKAAMGIDETVLYEDTSYTLGRTSVTLSESYKNFEIIKVFTNKGDVVFLKTDNPQSVNTCTLTHFNAANIWSIPWTFTDNTTFTGVPGVMLYSDSGTIKSVTVGSDAPYGRWEQPVKIVGIHRIAGGN